MSNTVWVADLDWVPVQVPGVVTCSSPRCQGKAVAILARRTLRGLRHYYYCAKHLYGRRIRDGVVEVAVAADSPAAQRGWTRRER